MSNSSSVTQRVIKWSLVLGSYLGTSCCYADEQLKSVRSLPGEVVVDHEGRSVSLRLTGYATRDRLGRKIYLIASYCEPDPKVQSAADVLGFRGVKQLRICMLRNIGSAIIARMIRRSFEAYDHDNQLAEEIARIEDHLRQNRLQIGDEIILTSLNSTALTCQINDEEPIVVHKAALTHVVWSVYFGDPPYLSAAMHRRLICRLQRPSTPDSDETATVNVSFAGQVKKERAD